VTGSPLLGSARIRRRLAQLEHAPLNFDLAALAAASPANGWAITDRCQALPAEPPGMPTEEGSWRIAQRLMRGYEFADPSIVRAHYDPDVPLERRTMLLELRALGIARLFVGVRVAEVYESTRRCGERDVHVWGWSYRTLEGHVEMGQMDWEVWKWLDSGDVAFRVHAVSRPAPIRNPVVRLGFHLLRGPERRAFLDSTERRMRTFTELALSHRDPRRAIREAAPEHTARPGRGDGPAHDAVAENVERPVR